MINAALKKLKYAIAQPAVTNPMRLSAPLIIVKISNNK
jgi:hypothetical protein